MNYRTSLFTVALFALSLTGCSKHSSDAAAVPPQTSDLSDAAIRQNLPGKWVRPTTKDGRQSTCTVDRDGKFECQITGFPDGSTLKLEGFYKVKDGLLIETVTNSSLPADSPAYKHVPYESSQRIVRMNGNEMVEQSGRVARKVTE
jgi:hypothetical protein